MQAFRPRRFAVAAGAALAVLTIAGPAAAAPTVEPTLSTLTGKPRHLVLGPDGNVWTPLSDSGVGNDIAKIAPDGTVTEFDVAALANAEGIASDGTNLWVTRPGNVAMFAPANPPGAVATPVDKITDPRAITLGPDGNMWTASGDQVVHFAPANPAGFSAQTVAGMGARGIAASSMSTTSGATGGALSIADFGGQRLVQVNAVTGEATFVALGGGPQEVAAGNGAEVAVANPGAVPQTVARVLSGNVLGTSEMPNTDPFGIVLANDGAYWTARFASGDVGRISPDGTVTALPIGAGTGPRNIAKGPGDTLFVGLETAMKVARISGVSAPPPPPAPLPSPTPTPVPIPAPAADVIGLWVRPLASGRRADIHVTVNRPAVVRIRVQRLLVGRLVNGRCVKATKRNAARPRCGRYTPVGPAFSVRATASRKLKLTVRTPRSVHLRPGLRYHVVATARAAGQTSAPAGVPFATR